MIWRNFLAIFLLGLSLTACASVPQQQAMERDLGEMKRRLADSERTVVALQQKIDGALKAQQTQDDDRLGTLARGQAEQRAEIDGLRVEMQAFSGRFEDFGHERREARDEIALMHDDLALKITAIEDRLAKAEAAQLAAPPPLPPPTPAESSEMLYQRGVEMIQASDFEGGREALKQFLKRNPQSLLAVNAIYWIGESYYGEKKFDYAILQYQEAVEKYKDHPKVASALLKQGYAFDALNDRKNAKLVLQRLVDTFPLSEEAKKGKERLQEWGKATAKK